MPVNGFKTKLEPSLVSQHIQKDIDLDPEIYRSEISSCRQSEQIYINVHLLDTISFPSFRAYYCMKKIVVGPKEGKAYGV